MVLTLGFGDLDQRACRQARGIGQHGTGYGDFIVACEMLDHARGRVFERRQPIAEFSFYPGFDPGNEMT